MNTFSFIIGLLLSATITLNGMVLKTKNVDLWTDHNVLAEHANFIELLSQAQKKNARDSQGNPFLHALFYAELNDIQLHGVSGHSHGFLKKSLARKLYCNNFDFNVTNNDGTTLLMLIAQEKDRYYNVHYGSRDLCCSCSSLEFETIPQLITFYKADPSIQDKDGFTALMHALHHDNTCAAIELIAYGSKSLNLQDAKGKTALIHAINKGNDIVTTLLLKQGADITICDNVGGSPLVYALMYAQKNKSADLKILTKLIELGAHLRIKKTIKISDYVQHDVKGIKPFLTMFETYDACREDTQKLHSFLQQNKDHLEHIFTLAALNNHQPTLDLLTEKPEDMLAILERCAKWNRAGATAYALEKLIELGAVSPTFADDKISFDTRSCCCSVFCWPFWYWSLSHKTDAEKFLLKKLPTRFTVHVPSTKRPCDMTFEATSYTQAFADFFKNYTPKKNEKTPLLKDM